MKIRQDVADLLHAGLSDREIAAQLHVDAKATVAPARAALGLPKARSGKKPASTLEEAFHRHTQRARDGHMRWTSPIQANGAIIFRWRNRNWTAYQAAFEIHNGRPASGKALPLCGQAQCVAPAHMGDQHDRKARTEAAREARTAQAASLAVPDKVIVDMLTAGHSIASIVRAHRVGPDRVREIRDGLGIEPHRPGIKPEAIDQTFRRRAVPTEDGHLLWPGTDYRINTIDGAAHSALRFAFRQKYGRNPIGKVLPGCGTARCVRPEHVEDRPMREALDSQLATIFGSAA